MGEPAELFYLDYAATSAFDPEVNQATQLALALPDRDDATLHKRIAACLGCSPTEIIFTSGGTEANNLAIRGLAVSAAGHPRKGRHIVSQRTEHPSLLVPLALLASQGFQIEWLPLDAQGRVEPAGLEEVLRPDTAFISVMHANNETGVLQPVRELAQVARRAEVPFHVDAAQGARFYDVSPRSLGADIVTVSGHKLGAPHGVGLLAGRIDLVGGRVGSRVARHLLVGLERALVLRQQRRDEEAMRVAESRDALERLLLERIPDLRINGAGAPRLPGHSNMSFPGISGEALVTTLDRAGISVSSGSACSTGDPGPSHVLLALGLDNAAASGSLRLSFSRPLGPDEVETIANALAEGAARLQQLAGDL